MKIQVGIIFRRRVNFMSGATIFFTRKDQQELP
jgi:hypothetical protein